MAGCLLVWLHLFFPECQGSTRTTQGWYRLGEEKCWNWRGLSQTRARPTQRVCQGMHISKEKGHQGQVSNPTLPNPPALQRKEDPVSYSDYWSDPGSLVHGLWPFLEWHRDAALVGSTCCSHGGLEFGLLCWPTMCSSELPVTSSRGSDILCWTARKGGRYREIKVKQIFCFCLFSDWRGHGQIQVGHGMLVITALEERQSLVSTAVMS